METVRFRMKGFEPIAMLPDLNLLLPVFHRCDSVILHPLVLLGIHLVQGCSSSPMGRGLSFVGRAAPFPRPSSCSPSHGLRAPRPSVASGGSP